MKETTVLVYGTLLSSCGNYERCLKPYIGKGAEFLTVAYTKPEHTLVSLGAYPGLIPFKGNTSIRGELYKITSKEVIDRLNMLEGFHGKDNPHNYYDQTEIETNHGKAIAYTLNENYLKHCPIIQSGDWLNRH